MSFAEVAKRKVAGVPVLYLAAGAVLILAVVAWRMKTDAKDPAPGDGAVSDEPAPTVDDPNVLAHLGTQGTVVAAAPVQTTPDPVVETDETWTRKAIAFLISEEAGPDRVSPGIAQNALAKYVNGDQLSFDEGKLRDAAVRKYGPPPGGATRPTVTSERPAQKQFQNLPGTHTVRGTFDDSYQDLSQLYYGTADWLHYSEIVAANPTLSPGGNLAIGTPVKIPQYQNPRYFVCTKDTLNRTKIAARNGITVYALDKLNPNLTNDQIKVGKRVRVA